MFLTKKGFWKIVIVAVVCFVSGSISFAGGMLSVMLGSNAGTLFLLGAVTYTIAVFSIFWGRYAEGKGQLINTGNKLVRNELRPAEFIKEYENLKNTPDLVVKKPDLEVLQLVAAAYDSLADKEHALATVDEMIAIARPKKEAYVKLIKASHLYAYHETEAAEQLFTEVQRLKPDLMAIALMDSVLKDDRAMAMGDYRVVEAYCLKLLDQKFPKLDRLGRVFTHHRLGNVYAKLEESEKAVLHYQYCVEHGGETALKASAKAAMESLKQITQNEQNG